MEPIVVKIDPDLEDLIPGFLDNRRADVGKLRDLLKAQNFTVSHFTQFPRLIIKLHVCYISNLICSKLSLYDV